MVMNRLAGLGSGALAEGGILWLTGRSLLFLGVLLGWLAFV